MEKTMNELEALWLKDGWILEQLLDIGKELKSVPMLEEMPTVVLVGSPNVGKSSIVRAISTGQPEVNDYPFTTRGMTLGHILDDITGERICQVMDTPGLLDRADEERNEMELLTLASMQHLPSLVVFVMDLSGGSGSKSPIDAQVQYPPAHLLLPSRQPDPAFMSISFACRAMNESVAHFAHSALVRGPAPPPRCLAIALNLSGVSRRNRACRAA